MSGHGHVVSNLDGSKARCGGPALCHVCAKEQAEVRAMMAEENRFLREQEERAQREGVKPTFDEWFEQAHGATFDALYMKTTGVNIALKVLARALRDYATEMAR